MAQKTPTRLLTRREMLDWLHAQPPSMPVAMLFGGDRFSCCYEFARLWPMVRSPR